jgi:hypothetical protein
VLRGWCGEAALRPGSPLPRHQLRLLLLPPSQSSRTTPSPCPLLHRPRSPAPAPTSLARSCTDLARPLLHRPRSPAPAPASLARSCTGLARPLLHRPRSPAPAPTSPQLNQAQRSQSCLPTQSACLPASHLARHQSQPASHLARHQSQPACLPHISHAIRASLPRPHALHLRRGTRPEPAPPPAQVPAQHPAPLTRPLFPGCSPTLKLAATPSLAILTSHSTGA